MTNKIFKKEVVIGICAILAIVVLVFGIDYLKGINLFKPANYYYVSYENVAGLTVSSPVTVNGFKVGQVREIEYEYENPGHILVQLSLNKNLRVPRGTKAVLKQDLLGTASIHLVMPAHDDMHDIGERIIGETDPGMLAGMGEKVIPAVDDILQKVDTLITSLNKIAASPALEKSVERLDEITAGVEQSVNSIRETVSLLNLAVAELPATMGNVNKASDNVEQMSENLLALSNELKEVPVKPMIDNLNATTENLRRISSQLDSPNSSLGLLLRDRGLYDNVNNTIVSLDSLLTDIKSNPKRYISIKLL